MRDPETGSRRSMRKHEGHQVVFFDGCMSGSSWLPSFDLDADLEQYPKVHQETLNHEGDIRAGAHSDYGSLTLLFQRSGQPGLEILTPHSTWSPVPIWPPGTEDLPFPPILVNIGDLMEFWTEGMLKSTVHRVVFPQRENQDRYSIAYFCHPLDHIEIEPVPSQVIRANCKPGVKMTGEMTAKAYLRKRLDETYNWGESQKAVASS